MSNSNNGAFLIGSLSDGGIAKTTVAMLHDWPEEDRPLLIVLSGKAQFVRIPSGVRALFLDQQSRVLQKAPRLLRSTILAANLYAAARQFDLQWIVASGLYSPEINALVSKFARYRSITWVRSGHHSTWVSEAEVRRKVPLSKIGFYLREYVTFWLNDRIVTLSPSSRRHVAMLYPHAEAKTGEVPGIVRLLPDTRSNMRGVAATGGFRLGVVGRFTRIKRQERAIYIADALRALGERVHLSVFGQGGEEARLREVVKEVGASNMVSFEGYNPDTRLVFSKFDVLLVTSEYEAFSNVVLEAFALGVLVVLDDAIGGGVNDLVLYRGESAAARCPFDDPSTAAMQLQNLLADKMRVQRMIELGRLRVLDFLPEAVVQKWRQEVSASGA